MNPSEATISQYTSTLKMTAPLVTLNYSTIDRTHTYNQSWKHEFMMILSSM